MFPTSSNANNNNHIQTQIEQEITQQINSQQNSQKNSQQKVTNMAGGKMKTKETKPKKRNPNSVLRRNARERDRIRNVNDAFDDLRNHVPNGECVKGRKISKVETLKSAIEYIHALRDILGDSVQPIDLSDIAGDGADEQTTGDPSVSPRSPESENGQLEKWSADQRSNTSSNENDGEQDLRGLLESSSRSLTESPESGIHSNETSMDLTNSKQPGPIESIIFGQNQMSQAFESVGGLTGFLNDSSSSPQASPTEITGLPDSLRSVLEQSNEQNHFPGYQNDALGLYQNTMNTLGENSPALDPSEINQNIMKTEPWNQSNICDNNSFATINATVNFENYDFTLLQSQFASNQGTVNGPSSSSGTSNQYSSLQFEF